MKKKVLVSGATGNQGGSVVQALLKEGNKVVGITRNIDSPKSQTLISQGVEMVSVDFTNEKELEKIMKEVDTVFSMTTPFEGGMEHEIEQGKSMVNAAKNAGIQHFIFNSVGDADRSTGIPHFDSKYEVEKHLKSLGINYTIIGPAYFMDNLFFPFILDSLKDGFLKMAMPGNVKLQQISVEDIGKFVAHVVNNHNEFLGKRINISGDEFTGEEAASTLSKVLGREIKYEGFSPDAMRAQSDDMATMYQWFIDEGYSANIDDLKDYNFSTFEQWASKQDWSMIH